MRNVLFAATAVLLSVGAAFANELGDAPVPGMAAARIVASPLAGPDAGSMAYPRFAPGPGIAVTTGNAAPFAGSEYDVESANSLPAGFTVGTLAAAQAQSVERSLQAQADRAARATLATR